MKLVRILVVAALAAALSVVIVAPAANAAVSGVMTECANAPSVTTCSGGWVTGGLNAGNSAFHEDDVVPQRLILSGLVPGSTGHVATITYDAKFGGVHGYDYLASYRVTVTGADACQGTSLTALCGVAPSTKDIPTDDLVHMTPAVGSDLTSTHELPQAQRQMTLFGGTVTAVSKPTHSNPTGAADTATVLVTFTAGATGNAIMVWGTHLAVGTSVAGAPHNWGDGNGASSGPGGSLATRVPTVDSTNVGGNNTIQSKSIGVFPPAAFTITKTASSASSTPGGAITYTVTVKNTGGQAGSTSFTDTASNGVTPTFVGPTAPSGGSCTTALVCSTSSLDPGTSQVFTFTATMPTSFTGAQTCTGGYNVTNTATITGVTPATATVCVAASSAFSITKTASSSSSTPGGSITYTVTVKNTGSAPGATSFTDAASNGVTPTFVGPTTPSGGSCTTALVCSTSSLNPGDSQAFTFTATMPSSFTGAQTCTGGYNVTNTATIAGVTPATATVCVTAMSGFSITKTASSPTSTPGGSITYTVTVKNTGTAPGSTSFTDTASNGVTPAFVGPTAPGGGSCTTALVCSTSSLDPGDSQAFTFTATMPSSFTGDPSVLCSNGGYRVTNTATLDNGSGDTAPVCVSAASAFSITKTASSPTSTPGGSITYTVTVKNTGSAPGSTGFTDTASNGVTPVFVTPSVPSGGTCSLTLACSTSALDPGDSQVFTFTATMPSSFTGTSDCDGGYKVTNTASLNGGGSDTATVCVSASSGFSITKTASSPTSTTGGSITYTVTVTNTGTAPGSTSFTDNASNGVDPVFVSPTAPSGGSCTSALVCTTSSLDPGDSQAFMFTATMPSSFTGASDCDGGYSVTNTATITGVTPATASVCVAAASAFSITKTASSPTSTPGGSITYTVTVENTGTAPGSTSFTDSASDGVSPTFVSPTSPSGGSCTATLVCSTSSLDPGDSQEFTFTATMPTSFTGSPGLGCELVGIGSYPVTNTATITGVTPATATVCVAASPDFDITKQASSKTAAAGDVITYTVTVTNTGSAPGATSFTDDYNDDATPQDPLPTNCFDSSVTGNDKFTCTTGVIDPGKDQVFTYDVTMPAAFSGTPEGCDNGGFPVVNSVTITDGDGADSAKVCVTTMPDFSITKEAASDTAHPGDVVSYTVTVTNNGSGPGTTSFTDDYNDDASPVLPLPVGCSDTSTATNKKFTCTTGSIDPGDSLPYTYSMTMPATFTGTPSGCDNGGYPVVNTVTITGGGSTDPATVCVDAAPDLSVSKSVSPTDPGPGDVVTYTVTVTNNGTAPGGTTVSDDYDQAHLTLGTVDAKCSDDGDVLTCTTGTIEAGDHVDFVYTATITDAFTGASDCTDGGNPGYTVSNTATIDGDSDTVDVCVPASPAFSIDKSVDPTTADPGDTVHYTIVVTNSGDAGGSTGFTDNFDDRVNPDTPTGSLGGTCETLSDSGDDFFSCVTATIPAHSSETFEYDAVLPDTFGSDDATCNGGGFSVSNVASLVTGGADAPAEVCVTAAPDFHVTKTVSDTHALPNQQVTYTIVVSNDGSAPGSTKFTDNFDDRLDASITAPDGCTKTTTGDLVLKCETGTIEPGKSQTFTYTAVMPDVLGGSGGDCPDGSFPVVNSVTVEVGGDTGGATVCVPAAPHFQIDKSVDDATGMPGQTVHYTVTVSNDGHVAGTTTFTDDYDNRLTVVAPDGCTAANGVLTCTTDPIAPHGHQDFTYAATLPATYTGASGGGDCDPGTFPVQNTATITSGEHGGPASQLVCVTAAPALHLSKSVVTSASTDSTRLTYTINYSNTGPAEATGVVLTDPIPDGTTFVSCSPDCTHTGSPVTASWTIGSVAPLTGSGSVTLVVDVTGKQACSVSNTAQIDAADVDPVSSNTVVTAVTPPSDPTGANAHGSAAGAQVLTAGLINLLIGHNGDPIGYSQSSQTGPGGPVTDSDSVLSAKVPSNGNLVKVGVINTASSSAVNGSPIAARQLSVAEVANVCLLPVGGVCTVEATALRSVAATLANGTTVGTSSAGSSITNLKIAGLGTPVDLNSNTKITLNPLVFGAGSYVAINERQSTTGLKDGKLYADMTTTMIHLKVTGLLKLQSAEIIVGQAKAHSEFLKTFECNPNANSVSGHAYVAGVNTGPLQTNVIQGFVGMGPKGGGSEQHLVALTLPAGGGLVNAAVADSRTQGTVSGTAADSSSIAEVAGHETTPACVVRSSPTACLVTAEAIHVEATSHADQTNGSVSTSAGTILTGVKVLGLPVDVNVPPNTTINLPGIGYVVLNEQTCDGGGLAVNGTCSGYPHSGITVRAVHVVITVLGNVLGLQPAVQVVVAEAHADSTVF